jgi:drug/metabolite transporter (DMT)-like permease
VPTAVIAALASAFCFALAGALQHREALHVGTCGVADVRLLWNLGRRPLWLVGVGCDLLSMALHVFALSLATLAVVQPLGVTGIVFAIPLAAVLRKQRIRRLDLAAAGAVVLGLIVLLRALPTSHQVRVPSVGLVLPASLAVLVLVAIMTMVGHFCPGRPRAILLAAGAGTAFGLTAVLVRTLIVLSRHVGTAGTVVAVSICIGVVGLAGYLLLQSAYRAGHFAASLATSTVLNPVVAVLAGALLLHEALPSDPGTLVVIGLAALLVCAGIALLVRSPAALSLAPQTEIDNAAGPGEVGREEIARQPARTVRIG